MARLLPVLGLLRAPAATPGASAEVAQRLRIRNGCESEPLWLARMAATGDHEPPGPVRLEPGESRLFDTPADLKGARYWPKMHCNDRGSECRIGESGGPGQDCDAELGCAPPVDTKFEASFGGPGELDWVDMSLVDGWTLPFKFEMQGTCWAAEGNRQVESVVDCSGLSLDECPMSEDVGLAGDWLADLQVVHPGTGNTVGCYSPCSKLTLGHWQNAAASGLSPVSPEVVPYCCPTPPFSPGACRGGPIAGTRYVQAVHENCPGVYGYSYDDGMGLLRCTSDTSYEVTFYCPSTAHRSGPPEPDSPLVFLMKKYEGGSTEESTPAAPRRPLARRRKSIRESPGTVAVVLLLAMAAGFAVPVAVLAPAALRRLRGARFGYMAVPGAGGDESAPAELGAGAAPAGRAPWQPRVATEREGFSGHGS